MGTSVATIQAQCPLCGAPVLSVSRAGRVISDEMYPIRLGPNARRGYSLCDDCGVLAHLPAELTLN